MYLSQLRNVFEMSVRRIAVHGKEQKRLFAHKARYDINFKSDFITGGKQFHKETVGIWHLNWCCRYTALTLI